MILYLVEWESQDQPGLWLGGYLFKYDTYEKAVEKFKASIARRPDLKFRLVKHEIINKMQVLEES